MIDTTDPEVLGAIGETHLLKEGSMTSSEQSDNEIEALRALCAALKPFDGKTRRRMLEWLVAYFADLPASCLPSMPDDRRGKQSLMSLSYSQERAAAAQRLAYYRAQLSQRGLMGSPYRPSGDNDRRWLSGYEAALRDLAEHPEIARAQCR